MAMVKMIIAFQVLKIPKVGFDRVVVLGDAHPRFPTYCDFVSGVKTFGISTQVLSSHFEVETRTCFLQVQSPDLFS